MTKYFKIINQNKKHHDFQYIDGLNILKGEFNDNNQQSNCPEDCILLI